MNFIKKIVLFLLNGFMALSVFTSCVVKNPDVPVTKITIHLTGSPEVEVGESVEFIVKFTPEIATDKNVEFSFDGANQDLGNFEEGNEPNVYCYIPNAKAAQQPEGRVTFYAQSANGVKGKRTVHVKSEIIKKTIILKETNGDVINTIVVTSNKIARSEIDTPSETTNGKFNGWYLDKECLNPVDFDAELKTENVFFAKRVPPATKVTVTFVTGSQSSSSVEPIETEVGKSIKLPQNLSSATHTFLGWTESEGSEKILGTTYVVNSDITLYAKWKENTVPVVHVESVTIGRVEANQLIGNTVQLYCDVSPDDADNKSVSYSTSNSTVATVSSTGLVTFKSAGNVTITVTSIDGGKNDSVTFTVEGMPATLESISILSSITVMNGKTKRIPCVFNPSDVSTESKEVIWTSSNTNVASVADDGTVSGVSVGQATITCTSKVNSEISAVCNVEVVESISGKIILHAKNYTHLWAWNETPKENYTGGEWPGVKMDPDVAEGWYTYTLNVDTSMVIFSNNGSGQTADLSRDAGEWWYTGGKWYDEDPSDSVKPEITNITASSTGTVSGEIKFAVSASDNKNLSKVVINCDGKKIGSVAMSEMIATVEFVWNTTIEVNGPHTIDFTVYDESGNASDVHKMNFTTDNENLKPVAVIGGSSNVGLGKEKTYNARSSYDLNGSVKGYSWSVSGGAQIVSGQNAVECVIQFPSTQSTCTVTLTVTDDSGAVSVPVSKLVAVQDMISTDFREETIYFAMTTRFYDGDPSNNVHCWDENPATPENDPAWRGDFKGLIEKLDYIKALGFSAIWITPIVENCSGMDYHGYHAMNLKKVDPRYESADTKFQDLIDAVHARGMKLVLDVVFNHVGNFGEENLCPMFLKDYSADLADINACLKMHPESLLPDNYWDLKPDNQYGTRLALMKNTDYQNHDYKNYFHHFGFGNWDNFSVQFFQMAGDCVELNTENPKVLKYIGDAYSQYIEMGVDAFRIDTGKHISRLEFNYYLNDRFMEAARSSGNDNFYMFTEICAKSSDVTYRGNVENLSPYFYTWKDTDDYGFTMADEDQFEGVIIYPESAETEKDEVRVLRDLDYWTRPTVDGGTKTPVNALAVQKQGMDTTTVRANRPESDNHLLNGNSYHEPDYSMRSGLDVIDFPMHWNFGSANGAFSVRGGDKYYNDATWNVVYVDSHDYGPGNQFEQRYGAAGNGAMSDEELEPKWAENVDLMWTFRGIPCLYYGSEVMFMKGAIIDKGPILTLAETGRAYFGDYLEGTVNASDFSKYTATGKVAETLNHPLAKHIQRMNMIRREIPALQKGQYSTEGCGSSKIAFKRRYTKDGIDSFVLVTISADTTFTGLPAGTYVDAITGDTKTVSAGGELETSGCTGQGNMRVYVLNGPGAIGADISNTYLK